MCPRAALKDVSEACHPRPHRPWKPGTWKVINPVTAKASGLRTVVRPRAGVKSPLNLRAELRGAALWPEGAASRVRTGDSFVRPLRKVVDAPRINGPPPESGLTHIDAHPQSGHRTGGRSPRAPLSFQDGPLCKPPASKPWPWFRGRLGKRRGDRSGPEPPPMEPPVGMAAANPTPLQPSPRRSARGSAGTPPSNRAHSSRCTPSGGRTREGHSGPLDPGAPLGPAGSGAHPLGQPCPLSIRCGP